MNKNKWFLNGGRESGRSLRLLCETYENKIADLQHKVDTLQGFLDHDIEYDMDKTIQELRKENTQLKDEWQEQVQKAKELLAKWVELYKPKGSNIPPTPIQVDTEQFLKEIK